MSQELVPMADVRAQWNADTGHDLPHHNDLLTAEQSAQINDHYRIEIYAGTHGIAKEEAKSPESRLGVSTQLEYQAVADIVEGLGPEDTLFIENYGFARTEPTEPLPALKDVNEWWSPNVPERLTETLVAAGAIRGLLEAHARTGLGGDRANYDLHAFTYGARLALLRGVRVVSADHDAFDQQQLEALAGRSLKELMVSGNNGNVEDAELAERVHEQRDKSTARIVKDWALEHMPAEASPRTPRLVILRGRYHGAALKQHFDDLGLHSSLNEMRTSSLEERVLEHGAYEIRQALGRVATQS